jgi:hypothetical protein
MNLILQRGTLPAIQVSIPAAAVAVADEYAQSIGFPGTEAFMLNLLLEEVLKGVILPRAQSRYAPEVAAQIGAMEAELEAKKAQVEGARIAPLLPQLTIGGQPTTLAQLTAGNPPSQP